MQAIPIILFGREYWQQVVNFQFLADQGTIADEDIELISYAETAAEAWETIQQAARYFDNGNYWADPAPIEHLT